MDNDVMSLDEILEDPYYMEQFNKRIKNMSDGTLKADSRQARMEEKQMTDAIVTNTATPQPEATPQTQSTQSAAVNVDMDTIVRLAEEKAVQKMDAVFKSMLTQNGLDPETAKAMTAEWKSKQTTPEQVLKAKDDEIAALQASMLAEQQKSIALMKGVPLADESQADKVNAVLTLAKSNVSDKVTYEQALDNALKVIRFDNIGQTGFVVTAGQSGGGAQQKTAADEILLAAQQAMGIIVN